MSKQNPQILLFGRKSRRRNEIDMKPKRLPPREIVKEIAKELNKFVFPLLIAGAYVAVCSASIWISDQLPNRWVPTSDEEQIVVGYGRFEAGLWPNFTSGSNAVDRHCLEMAKCNSPVGQDGSIWNLVFWDEFDGTSLDNSKWIDSFPWGYTSTTTPDTIYQSTNVIVDDGTLHLRATDDVVETYTWTSGMISTAGPFETGPAGYKRLFQYGYFEMRAKVPIGQGLWPAFWLLPPQGKHPPEIDVMEILGHTTDTIHMTVHYSDENEANASDGATWAGSDFSDDYHVFGLSWDQGTIRWYVDGIERRTAFVEIRYIPSEPMYLLLNLQVGGVYPGDPDETIPFPSDFDIDYVRVWERDYAWPIP